MSEETIHDVWPDLPEHDPIAAALEVAQAGAFDGAHHKQWVIDQMVRVLTGCPKEVKTAVDAWGHTYFYRSLGESEGYRNWLKDFQGDPEQYEPWDPGIAP